jgi:hypothetical protein
MHNKVRLVVITGLGQMHFGANPAMVALDALSGHPDHKGKQ